MISEPQEHSLGEAEYQKGLAFLENKQVILALKAFKTALLQDETLAGAYYQIAQIHYQLSEYPEALEHLHLAIQYQPELIEALEIRGNIFLEQGLRSKAEADYLNVIALDPEKQAALSERFYANQMGEKSEVQKMMLSLKLDTQKIKLNQQLEQQRNSFLGRKFEAKRISEIEQKKEDEKKQKKEEQKKRIDMALAQKRKETVDLSPQSAPVVKELPDSLKTPPISSTIAKKTEKKFSRWKDPEFIAFMLFLNAILVLGLLAILPAPKKKKEIKGTSFVIPSKKNVSEKNLPKKDPEDENLPKIDFPEEKSEWTALLNRHLWRVAYSPDSKQIYESKIFLKTVPEKTVEEYIRQLLYGEKSSERIMGAVAVKYIPLRELIDPIANEMPSVREEEGLDYVPFYLDALSLGNQSHVSILLSYATHSQNIRYRIIALESLAQIKEATRIVPDLFEYLSQQKQQNAEFVALTKTIIALISSAQYPLLTQLLDSSNSELRKMALIMMKEINLEHFASLYLQMLNDSSIPVRKQAYLALMQLKDDSTSLKLIERAQNKEIKREERIWALETAGRCSSTLSLKNLKSFLAEKDQALRFVAYTILAYTKEEKGVAGLIELLQLQDNDFIVEQGSDLEEERSWLEEQIYHVLKEVTKREFSDAVSWQNWWLTQKKFSFPDVPYMENPPKLYEQR